MQRGKDACNQRQDAAPNDGRRSSNLRTRYPDWCLNGFKRRDVPRAVVEKPLQLLQSAILVDREVAGLTHREPWMEDVCSSYLIYRESFEGGGAGIQR